jgi:hypothetical protein
MIRGRSVRIKSISRNSEHGAELLARATAAGPERIAWEHAEDGRVRLPDSEGERAFTAMTGLDARGEGCTPLAMCLHLAFASEAASRKERADSGERHERGRPAQHPAFRRLLAEAVDQLGGAAPAALFLLIHGFDSSTLLPASAHRRDVRRVYTGLVKDLSRIARITPRTQSVAFAALETSVVAVAGSTSLIDLGARPMSIDFDPPATPRLAAGAKVSAPAPLLPLLGPPQDGRESNRFLGQLGQNCREPDGLEIPRIH